MSGVSIQDVCQAPDLFAIHAFPFSGSNELTLNPGDRCQRAPFRKLDPAPNPDVLRSLEAKLADLKFTSPY